MMSRFKCPKCNSIIQADSKYCPKCGFGLNSKKIPFKKLQIPAVFAFLIALLLLSFYLYITPQSIIFNLDENFSPVADGKSSFCAPARVFALFGNSLEGVKISGNSQYGKIISCTTNYSGECDLCYIPKKSPQKYSEIISINSNGATRDFSFEVLSDIPAKIILEKQDEEIDADGISGTKITAQVFNKIGESVADETLVNFEASPIGSAVMSENFCKTLNGNCSITIISTTKPAQIVISANSKDCFQKTNLSIIPLLPEKIIISSKNNSVLGNGKSEIMINAYLENRINDPVFGMEVYFSSKLGSIEEKCVSGSDGKCSVKYTAPISSGFDTITAYIENLSTNFQLELLGFSSLEVDFSKTYLLGDPIVPAFSINHDYLGQNMVDVSIYNSGTKDFSGIVELSIPGWSSTQVIPINVQSRRTAVLGFNPALNSNVYSNHQNQPVYYLFSIKDENNNEVYKVSVPTTLVSYTQMYWSYPYLGSDADKKNNLVIFWVNPNSDEIHQLISDAAKYTPTNAFLGYQTYSTGCGTFGLESCTLKESTTIQMKAVYTQLQTDGMKYVNAPGNYFSGSQTIYTPTQTLESGSANCIDGSLVFASAFVLAGMKAYLVLVPNHAFVCIAESQTSNYISCVETTKVGSGDSFEDAVNSAISTFNTYYSSGDILIIDVNSILSQINSVPEN
ncbi:MAG: zinc ribbon domain-containing protein [Candidatus Micrarchaeia archaeon]